MGLFSFTGKIIIVIWCWVSEKLTWPRQSQGQGYVLMSDCDVLMTHNCDDCNPTVRVLVLPPVEPGKGRPQDMAWVVCTICSARLRNNVWFSMENDKITTVEVVTKPTHFLCSVCGYYCLKSPMCYISNLFFNLFFWILTQNLNIFANYIMGVY